MGYNRHNFPAQENTLTNLGIIKKHCRVIELGCQQMWFTAKRINPRQYYRDISRKLWKEIVSVDLVGPDWVKKYDLTKPLPDLGKFDVVLNMGTAEHVGYTPEEQEQFWVNIDNLGKEGTVYIHDMPEKGSWLEHPCQWRYDMNSLAKMCLDKNYKIWEMNRIFTGDQGWSIYLVYIK